MSLLLSCQNLAKTYGSRRLFTGITMGFYEGERTGLFGPNGAGKSTLMKILAQREQPDDGTLEIRRGVKVGYLPQQDRFSADTPRNELLHALADAHLEEHERDTQIAIMLTKIGFDDHDVQIATLSGGWRKRLALARELILQPHLLLLDEPTNHLDLEGILWLESLLKSTNFSFVVVTHDRYFLENVTNRVIEINPMFTEGYLSVPGTYSDFLERRDVVLEAQAKQEQTLKQQVKKEIDWLRRGPKAQRNKNKSRIKDAHEKIDSLAESRQRSATDAAVEIEFSATERKTKKLLAAHNLCKTLGSKRLIDKLNLVLSPGMKLGVLGPNGSGKSTLLKLLTGDLEPDSGNIKRAPGLRIVFFDQQRRELDKQELLKTALAGPSDSVVYNNQLIHITSWARRFLFRYEQLDRPVGELSGGEQARVLVARLMLRPADVLILDEPTNDLDIPSLEVLESSLEEFPGALVLVTHDRFMLDRLSSEIVGLDGFGNHAIITDYDQYENWAKAQAKARKAAAVPASTPAPATAQPATKKPGKKLTYHEQKELDTIETRILEAETLVQERHKPLEDPATMADHVKMTAACAALHDAQEAVAKLYERWQFLEAKQSAPD